MPFTYGLVHFSTLIDDQSFLVGKNEIEYFRSLVFQFVGFDARDLNHPRATKRSLVTQHFQRCFHRQALILFQCVVLNRSQPPFATI